ncbi:unnamed protein product [Pedinophyceae sp. YPF-701]|nr:unnamed protein product [Pedinophyceae sp. YPF-701]
MAPNIVPRADPPGKALDTTVIYTPSLPPASPASRGRPATIEELPTEVLETIFARVPGRDLARCAGVSRHWRALAGTEFLWRRVVGVAEGDLVRAATLAAHNRMSESLRELGVSAPTLAPEALAIGRRSYARLAPWLKARGMSPELLLESVSRRRAPPTPAGAARAEWTDAWPQDSLLKSVFGAAERIDSNWRNARYQTRTLSPHSGNVECLVHTRCEPLGDVIVSGGWDGQVVVTGRAKGNVLRSFNHGAEWVTCVAAGQALVASGSTDGSVKVWSYGLQSSPMAIMQYLTNVASLAFLHNSERYLSVGLVDGKLHVWDLQEGSLVRILRGHQDVPWMLKSVPLHWKPRAQEGAGATAPATHARGGGGAADDAPAFAGGTGPDVAAIGVRMGHLAHAVAGLAGQRLPSMSGEALDRVRAAMETLHDLGFLSRAREVAPTTVLACARDGMMRAWNVLGPCPAPPQSSLIQIISEDGLPGLVLAPAAEWRAHTSAVLCTEVVDLSSLSEADCWRDLAVAQIARLKQRAVDRASKEKPATGAAPERSGAGASEAPHAVPRLGVPPANSTAAVAAPHDFGAGADEASRVLKERGPGQYVRPPGIVVTGGADRCVRVWCMQDLSLLQELKGHWHGVLSVSVSFPQRPALADAALPPGAGVAEPRDPRAAVWVLSGSHDGEVRVWDMLSGSCLAILGHHAGPVATISTRGALHVTLAPTDGLSAFYRHPYWPADESGASFTFAHSLALDPRGLSLGTQTGEVLVHDFSPPIEAIRERPSLKDTELGCPHFSSCSGCTMEKNLGMPRSARQAQALFRGMSLPFFIDHGPPRGWRFRARLAVRGKPGKPVVGLFRTGTHEAIAMPNCTVHHPRINDAAAAIRDVAAATRVEPYSDAGKGPPSGDLRYVQLTVEPRAPEYSSTPVWKLPKFSRDATAVEVVLVWAATDADAAVRDSARLVDRLWRDHGLHGGSGLVSRIWINAQPSKGNAIFAKTPHSWRLVRGTGALAQPIADGLAVSVGPGSFMQANLEMAARAVAFVADYIPAGARLTDLHAGVGAIGFALAARGGLSSLRCVEVDEAAAAAFRSTVDAAWRGSARAFGIERPRMHVGRAGDAPERWTADTDVVVVDPPRKGLEPALLSELADGCADKPGPNTLVYFSCGFPALQRDVAALLEGRAGWEVAAARGFVFFPGSDHIETVVVLKRT